MWWFLRQPLFICYLLVPRLCAQFESTIVLALLALQVKRAVTYLLQQRRVLLYCLTPYLDIMTNSSPVAATVAAPMDTLVVVVVAAAMEAVTEAAVVATVEVATAAAAAVTVWASSALVSRPSSGVCTLEKLV